MNSIRYNIESLKLLKSMSNKVFVWMFICNIIELSAPYYNIFLSSSILNAIAKNSEVKLFILAALIGNFLISVGKSVVRKLYEASMEKMSINEKRIINQHLMEISYGELEDTKFRQLRRKVDENARIGGYGKDTLFSYIDALEYNILNFFIAIYLFVEMLFLVLRNGFNLMFFCFIILLVVSTLINLYFSRWMQKKEVEESSKIAEMMSDENRYDGAIDYNMGKDVRIYRQDRIIMAIKNKYLIDDHKVSFEKMFRKMFKVETPYGITVFLLKFLTYSFVCFFITKGYFEIGGIVKYVGFVEMFTNSILSIFQNIGVLKNNTPFVKDYLDMMQYGKDTGIRAKQTNVALSDINNAFEFKNVYYKYPGCNNYALQNVSFKFGLHQKLAIVGANGSGKTTLVKLLCRLYQPTKGEILFNGKNIWEYKYEEYISLIAAVFQDFKLFSFSVAENIAFCDIPVEDKLKNCLNMVGLYNRVKEMPKGIYTPLYRDFDQDGIEISGGEAQKIALARAIYKEAHFIIFDEPTSALDPVAEYDIYRKLDDITKNRAVMYISHRLSSCKFCDKIIVMDRGEIVQFGSHKELMINTEGKYCELWNAQAKFYID